MNRPTNHLMLITFLIAITLLPVGCGEFDAFKGAGLYKPSVVERAQNRSEKESVKTLGKGGKLIVTIDGNTQEAVTSNKSVVDIVARSSSTLTIEGKGPGTAEITYPKKGGGVGVKYVTVEGNADKDPQLSQKN